MTYLGDFPLGATIYFRFTTLAPLEGPTSLSAPTGTVYKGASLTPNASGFTVSGASAGGSGGHLVTVSTTADAAFYTGSADFFVLLTGGEVASVALSGAYTLCQFSLTNRSPLRPTVAGRTLDVTATGEAGIDWANIGSPTTAQNLTGTQISRVAVVSTVSLVSVVAVVNQIPPLSTGAINAATFTAGAIDNAAFNVTETLTATLIAGAISAAAFANSALTASAVDTSTRAVVADAVLGRDFSTVSQVASRSLLEANRFLRNNRFFSGGSLVVTREDDTTQAWSAVVTTSSTVDAVTGVDPG